MGFSRKIKILFFPAWFPNHNNPIGGSFVVQHAKSIQHEVDLAVFHVCIDYNLNKWFQTEDYNIENIRVVRVYFKGFNNKFFFALNAISYLYATIFGYFIVSKRFGKADINHVHVLTRTAILPFFLNKIFRTPYVISEHWSRYLPERNSFNGFLRKKLTKFLISHSNGIAAVSNSLKQSMIKHDLSHPHFSIISNAINTSFFKPKEKPEGIKFNFIHVSGMQDEIKNISGIINSIFLLSKEIKSFTFHFVGDSTEIEKYKKQVKEYQIEEYIKFHGELLNDELVNQYQLADALVLFSYFETQSCVILESFSMGIPVISSEVGGVNEIVNDMNGVLVESRNIECLKTALKDMILNKNHYNTLLIRNSAVEKYGYKAVSNQLKQFYQRSLDLK